MKLTDFAETLKLKRLTDGWDCDGEVSGCYVGDLLSWVMGRAAAGDAWLTVMGNINAVAVASLTEATCIVLCENASFDADAHRKAQAIGIPVFVTEKSSYTLAAEISGALGQGVS